MSEWRTWQIVDSAFPTGTFAHSWGLESAWQHGEVAGADALREYLDASVLQAGFGMLPFLNQAWSVPEDVPELDALAEAFLTNAVANRASRVQGRTLAATAARVWPSAATTRLEANARQGCAHVAPLSGAVFRALDLPLDVAQRVALYAAARGVLSAAVRLGIVGTYEAQRLQRDVEPSLDAAAERCARLTIADLTQTAPLVDLLQAAHDRLYSRLFQS
jgi:urease accessory protein